MSNQLNQNIQNLENILNDINNISIVEQSTPSITVSSSGLITSSITEDTGYINGTTTSATKQLTTKAATSITPSTSSQTAVNANTYTTGAITVNAIPSSYVKPSATKAATTYTPTTSNQTIAAGTYCSGTQTIKGDTNLKATNIKSGVSIFGVAGSYAEAPVLLWTNASPTSSFAKQTVNVSGANYSAYIIECRATTEQNDLYCTFINIGSEGYCYGKKSGVTIVTGGLRNITSTSTTSVEFGIGYSRSGGNLQSSNYCGIPTRIWGVKFTL